MIKKIAIALLFSLLLLVSNTEAKQPKLVLLSIGVNYHALEEEREDVYANEARHLVNSVEKHCDTIYSIEKKCLYSEEATREACLEGLDWAAENSDEGDLTLVYIGTHGGGTKDGGYEFYPATKKVTSVEIISKLGNMKSHLFLIIDSCYAGAMILDWKKPGNNVSIVASCQPEEGSSVWKIVIPFRDALSKADYNDDKTIDLVEIGQYLVKNGGGEKQKPMSSCKTRKVFCEVERRYILPHREGLNMLAETLRESIKSTGKPIYQVAKESGVAQPVLSRFMSGKRGITLDTAEKLSSYLRLKLVSDGEIRLLEELRSTVG